MEDHRKVGCTLAIYFSVYLNEQYTLDTATEWIKSKSGLTKEYVKKIMAVQVFNKINLRIKFDASANCFEAIMQIRNRNTAFRIRTWKSNTKIIEGPYIRAIECPCGTFIKIFRSADFDRVDSKSIIEEFEKYGEVARFHRVLKNDVCTGEIEMVLLANMKSQIFNKDWLEANKYRLKVGRYFATVDDRIPEKIVSDLWKKSGYHSIADGQRNVEVFVKSVKKDKEKSVFIEQVD